jgi:hypothetical protein
MTANTYCALCPTDEREGSLELLLQFYPKAFALHPSTPSASLTPPVGTMMEWTKSSIDHKAFDGL